MATCAKCGAEFVPPFATARLCLPCWQASAKPTAEVIAELRAEADALRAQVDAACRLLEQALEALGQRGRCHPQAAPADRPETPDTRSHGPSGELQ
jgi:hypothetical protein